MGSQAWTVAYGFAIERPTDSRARQVEVQPERTGAVVDAARAAVEDGGLAFVPVLTPVLPSPANQGHLGRIEGGRNRVRESW